MRRWSFPSGFEGCLFIILFLPALTKCNLKPFALEEENPNTGRKEPVNLDSVSQGCENSPVICENWSTREPETWVPPSQGGTLLQFVDATATEEDCVHGL